MQVTILLRKVLCGMELEVVQEGIPAAISSEPATSAGRSRSRFLAHLVELEIPDGA
jgi:hypothetical protein